MGVAAIGGLLSSGISAVGSVMGGAEKARAIHQQAQETALSYAYEAGQLEIAAAVGDLKATQTYTAMTQKTQNALSTVDSVMALTGTTDQSPSSWAVKNRFHQLSDDARDQAVWNLHFDAESKRMAAVLYKIGAMNAITSGNAAASDARQAGVLGGIGDMLGGIGGMFKEGGFGF